MYSDDVKLLLIMYSCLLQSALNNFVTWCPYNFMTLDPRKNIQNFSIPRRNSLAAALLIYSQKLANVDSFMDLGV